MNFYQTENTLAVMFDNPALLEALTECAHDLVCDLWEAEEPGIFVTPHFLAIYDDKAVVAGIWDTLVAWQEDAAEWYARDVLLRRRRFVCWADELEKEGGREACLGYEDVELTIYEAEEISNLTEAVILLGDIGFSRELFGVRVYRCAPHDHESILRIVKVEHQRVNSTRRTKALYIGKREQSEEGQYEDIDP